MDFIEKIKALATRCEKVKSSLQNEEQAKLALVQPFIAALGYDVFDPTEVVPEYQASMGVKKDARV